MSFPSIERTHAEIVTTVAKRIGRRPGSVFHKAGNEFCRKHAEAGLGALQHDLRTGNTGSVRKVAYALIDELGALGLGFSDLRSYVLSLRHAVRDAIASVPEADDIRTPIEEWFFELLLVCTMRFMAWRNEQQLQASAKQSVKHLESQLVELEQALVEKTELLDLIHKTSTPIVPVVSGILVVPLIGTFDAIRAELLTEKLLNEVVRYGARTAILDISGVPVFDAEVMQLLVRLVRSVQMLGALVLVVGMSPTIAKTVVELRVDLSMIESYATLQDGLAQALIRQGMKIT